MDNDTNSITEEQKERLLEVIKAATDKVPGVGAKLANRIKQEYGVDSYTKLSRAQMDELIAWVGADIEMLDVGLPLRCASDKGRAYANATLITLRAARRELPLEEWKLVLEDLLDVL